MGGAPGEDQAKDQGGQPAPKVSNWADASDEEDEEMERLQQPVSDSESDSSEDEDDKKHEEKDKDKDKDKDKASGAAKAPVNGKAAAGKAAAKPSVSRCRASSPMGAGHCSSLAAQACMKK